MTSQRTIGIPDVSDIISPRQSSSNVSNPTSWSQTQVVARICPVELLPLHSPDLNPKDHCATEINGVYQSADYSSAKMFIPAATFLGVNIQRG